uniref:Polygalacturonase n=1 Tax=Pinus taeda TaxID=3352 RepID=A0A5B8LDQ1_PINTA|nr:polygalacturonase [Pinus taeda]
MEAGFSRYARMKILLSVLILLSFREIGGREISDKQTTSSSERRGAAFLVMGEVRSEVALRGVHTGSAPPSCVAKCEGCNPCKPVQCVVTPKLQCIPKRVEDYYPVLWKCGCGNKIFNP